MYSASFVSWGSLPRAGLYVQYRELKRRGVSFHSPTAEITYHKDTRIVNDAHLFQDSGVTTRRIAEPRPIKPLAKFFTLRGRGHCSVLAIIHDLVYGHCSAPPVHVDVILLQFMSQGPRADTQYSSCAFLVSSRAI